MATNATNATRHDTAELVKRLLHLEYDAIGAYQAAIERVQLEGNPLALTGFLHDHERHVRDLADAMRALGENAPEQGDLEGLLTKGKVLATGPFGDSAVLRAMKSNEEDVCRVYDEALGRSDLPPSVREIVAGHANDEQRHWAWFDERIVQLAGEVTE